MKKGLQLSAAAVIALSAITPVATAAAAEPTAQQVKPGIYTTEGYTSIADFKKLTTAKKAALLQKPGAVLVVGTDVIPTEVILTGTNDDLENSKVSVEKYQEDNKVVITEDGIKPVTPEETVTVSAVSAINATTVEVTFGKDVEVTAEELKDQVLKIKDAEGKVVEATYRDGSLADGKAFFDLPLNEKLIDAVTYTAELGESKAQFVAKILAPFAKKFNVVTTTVTATGDAPGTKSIYFDAVDQFGDAIELASVPSNIAETVTYNGLPLTSPSEYTLSVVDGNLVVTINETDRTLAKDAKLEVKIETVDADDKVIETSTASFTVVEGATAVPTTIEAVNATYAAVTNDRKVGDKVTEVLPNDEVKLTAVVKDQYGNPVTSAAQGDLVRWVVTSGKDLITDTNGNAFDATTNTPINNVTFKAAKPGTVTIVAYNLANGSSKTYTVEIAASKLTAVAVDTSNTVKDAEGNALVNANPYNNEEAVVAVLDATPGSALLKAEDVKFEVKTSTKDVTNADLTVKAEKITVGKGSTAKEYIVVKATSAKTAVFTVTPYVGESFEKATIKGSSDITVNSVANPTVDKIEVEEVKANELQAKVELVKAVKFFNKHGEQINVTADALTSLGTTGLTINKYVADAEGNKAGAAIGSAKVAFLGFTASAKGNYTANLVAGPKSVSVALTAVEAGKIQSLTLAGGSAVSVITNDSYDAKDENDNVVVVSGKAYTLIPVSAKDNYGVDVKLASADLDTTTKNANVEVKYFSDLKGTETTTDVKYIGVHAATGATTEAFTVNLADPTKAVEGFVAPSKQITVTAARKADKVNVTPTSLNLGLGGTTTIKVNVVDQYGKAFDVANLNDITITAADFAITGKKQSVDTKGDAITGQYEFKAQANDTGSKTIEVTVAGVATKSTVNVNVAPASEIVKSLDITGKDVKDGVAVNKLKSPGDTTQLTVVGKDANGSEVDVNQSEVVWTSNNEALATVENGLVTLSQTSVTKDEEVTITADVFGVKQSITFTISKEGSALKSGTLTLTDADKIDADSKTEGVQVYLDADTEATDGETDGAVTLTFTGKDQYGDNFTGLKVNATSYNAAVAKAVVSDNNKVIVTAVKAGETKVRVTVGAEELIYTVKVTEDAVAKAQTVVALQAATTAVETAEESKTQTDVDAAQALVTALPAGAAKDALQDRIDAIVVTP